MDRLPTRTQRIVDRLVGELLEELEDRGSLERQLAAKILALGKAMGQELGVTTYFEYVRDVQKI